MRKLLIFEGISGSGKSTLEDAYREANNYYDYTMHRFTPSKYVYSLIYRRQVDLRELQLIERQIQGIFQTYLIQCVIDPDVARERKKNLWDHNVEEELARSQALFKNYFSSMTELKNKVMVDTSKPVGDCIKDIWEFVR
jgi:thymidylate kinase